MSMERRGEGEHSGAAKRLRKEVLQGGAVTHVGEGEGLRLGPVPPTALCWGGMGEIMWARSVQSAVEGKRNVLKGWPCH